MRKYLSGLFAFLLAAVLVFCTGVSASAMTVSYSPTSARLSKGISVMKSGSAEREKLENAIDAIVNTPLSVQSESDIQNAIISAIDSAMGKCGSSNCWTSSNADYKVYIYKSEYTLNPKNGSLSDSSTSDGIYSFSVALKWQQETDLAGLFSEKYAEYIPWITNKSNPSAAEVFTVAIKAKSYCETVGQNCIFEETTIVDASATCTEDGSGHTIKTCAVCGHVENGENIVIPATGHTEGEWMLVSEDVRPCGETGSETWELHCAVCDELLEEEVLETYAEHEIIPATCTQPETCAVCGETFSTALGHKKGAYSVITAPSCETDGLIGFTCTECGAYVTETIPALGHDPGDDYREGSKSEMQNLYNEYMGISMAKSDSMSFANVILDNSTYYCYHCVYCGEVEMGKVCNHENTVETFYKVAGYNSDGTPVFGAESTDVDKDRCSADIVRILVCSDCGETVFSNILAKHDHEYAIYLGTSATCAMAGDVECRQKKCIYCGGTKTLAAAERVSVSGEYNMGNHDKKSMVNQTSVNGVSLLLVAGDCRTPSVYLTICTRCKGLITEERVNEARTQYLAGKKVEVWYKYEDHTWIDGESVEATCEHAGHTTQVCSVCNEAGETSYQSVKAHSYEVDNSSADWTLDDNGMPADVTVDLYCTSCSRKVTARALMIREIADAYIVPTCSTPGKRTFSALVTADSERYTFQIDVTLPINPEAHNLGDYVSDNNATCTANCTETAECTLCHDKVTREIENTALGHNQTTNYIDEIPATCSTEGSRVKVIVCDRCNEELLRETETLAINPDNHESELIIDGAVGATCTSDGLTEGSHYECCGKVISVQSIIPALGHDPEESAIGVCRNGAFDEYGNFVTTNCVTDGDYEIIYSCNRCGENVRTETVQVNANGPHAYMISYIRDDESCTATAECTNELCGSVITEHSRLSFVLEEDATCSSDALGHYIAEFNNELFGTWISYSEYLQGTRLDHIWGNPRYSMSAGFTSCTCTFECVREYTNLDDACGVTRTITCSVTPITIQEPSDCATEKKIKYEITAPSEWEGRFDTILFPDGQGTGEFGAHVPSPDPEIGSVANGTFNESGEFVTSDCITNGSYELVYRCCIPGCHESNPVLHTSEIQVLANGPHANTEFRTRTVSEATKTSNRWDQDYTWCLDCETELVTGEPYEVDGTQLPDHVHTWTTYYTYGSTCQIKGDTRRKCSDPNCPEHADELVSSGTGYAGSHNYSGDIYYTYGGTCQQRGDKRQYCIHCSSTTVIEYGAGYYGNHYYSGDIFYTTGSDCQHYGNKCQYCYFCHSAYIVLKYGEGYRGVNHVGGTSVGDPQYINNDDSHHTVSATEYCNGCGEALNTSSYLESHSFAGRSCTVGGTCVCGYSKGPREHNYARIESSEYLCTSGSCTEPATYYWSCVDCGEPDQTRTFPGEGGGTHRWSSSYSYEYSPASGDTHDVYKDYGFCLNGCGTRKKEFYKTKSCSPSGAIHYLGGDTYAGNDQHHCPRTQNCSKCGQAVYSEPLVSCTKQTTSRDYTKYNDSSHYVTTTETCKECGNVSTSQTTESHNKSVSYPSCDTLKHRKKESCSACGWSKITTENHFFVQVSSTRSECACGKIMVNGVIKAIRPGEDVMGTDDELSNADAILQNFEIPPETLDSEELAMADNKTNAVMIVSDIIDVETDDVPLPEILEEPNALIEDASVPAEETPPESSESTNEITDSEDDGVVTEEDFVSETEIISEPTT